MNSTLRNKAIFVLAIILVCVYGIIGLPKSKDELLKNWNENIRLGLDLKGGSQLVLQVQAQDKQSMFRAFARGCRRVLQASHQRHCDY